MNVKTILKINFKANFLDILLLQYFGFFADLMYTECQGCYGLVRAPRESTSHSIYLLLCMETHYFLKLILVTHKIRSHVLNTNKHSQNENICKKCNVKYQDTKSTLQV